MARDAVDFVERTGGVQIELPADPGSVSLARMLLHSLAERRDLDDEGVEDLVLAVSEACSIGAGAPEAPPRSVQVRWREEDDRVLVDVLHPGPILYDTTPLGRPASDPPTDPGRAALEGRLQLQLIHALVDEVEVDDGRMTLTVYCGPWEGLDES